MAFIWQQKNWPNFTWNNKPIEQSSNQFVTIANQLVGKVSDLSKDEESEVLVDLMVSETVKTSQIEGENYNRDDVRSSIRNQLKLNNKPEKVGDPKANGIASLMVSVREYFADPLTAQRLYDWQDKIIVSPHDRRWIDVGKWRTHKEPMLIVSGAFGKEKTHYEAPPSDQVPAEMVRFINWFNNSKYLSGPIRAGIAHLYFECIHPFADGNGRVGRAISELALSQSLGHPVLMSLSTTIMDRQSEYYDALKLSSQGTLDITKWLVWFTTLILDSQRQAIEQIEFVLSKARFWDKHNSQLNDRQSKVIARMLREGPDNFIGGMSANKYGKITKCSKATATRDMAELLKIGAFQKLNGGGRSTRYKVNLPVTQVIKNTIV